MSTWPDAASAGCIARRMSRRRSPVAASVDTRDPAAGPGERLGDARRLGRGALGVALGEQERLARADRSRAGCPRAPSAPRYAAIRASPAASMSSRTAGRMRAAVTAADAAAAASTSGNAAATVTTSPGVIGPQPHGGLDDDAERALRARQERGEVVAGHALHGAVPGAQQPPVGEHDREPEHRLAGHAVLRAQQAAGVRRDVAADRRDRAARGVGREPEAERGERVVEVAVQHARLDDGELVGLGDLEDAVHARDVEHDRAGARDGAAGEAGARSARHDRACRWRGRCASRPARRRRMPRARPRAAASRCAIRSGPRGWRRGRRGRS